ncbi:N-6 DNA methylase [Ferruginibacter sp.]|nr:N-6 DNA methylase [Ferruginibacter sp.]
MELLGRYYTSDVFSKLLVSQFTINRPLNIVDLGVGGGALIRAAINRWTKASYFVGDVDRKSIVKIQNELPFVNSFHLNTLKEEVSDKLNIKNGKVDIAICNPPFLKVKNEISYDDLFDDANLSDCKNLKLLTSDVIFLAKNLQLLKQKGELGIILPDSLITGKEFMHLRNAILKEHNLKAIIELPEKIYAKTEALTHILLIEKGGTTSKRSPLFLADKTGQIIDEIEGDKSALCERMDYKYHLWKKKVALIKENKVIGDLKIEIKRGSLTHKELKATKDYFIHTTEIINKKSNQATRNHFKKIDKYLLTQKGDILLARVGRGCTGKVCMISRGKVPISDCVYRIRVPKKFRMKVWNSLSSNEGQNWLKANCHGVCAKVISKRDLLKFPLQ